MTNKGYANILKIDGVDPNGVDRNLIRADADFMRKKKL